MSILCLSKNLASGTRGALEITSSAYLQPSTDLTRSSIVNIGFLL